MSIKRVRLYFERRRIRLYLVDIFSAIIFYQMPFCYIIPMIHVYKTVMEIYSGGTEFTILAGYDNNDTIILLLFIMDM